MSSLTRNFHPPAAPIKVHSPPQHYSATENSVPLLQVVYAAFALLASGMGRKLSPSWRLDTLTIDARRLATSTGVCRAAALRINTRTLLPYVWSEIDILTVVPTCAGQEGTVKLAQVINSSEVSLPCQTCLVHSRHNLTVRPEHQKRLQTLEALPCLQSAHLKLRACRLLLPSGEGAAPAGCALP